MLLASHGKVHKPHPLYNAWQRSITFTDSVIDRVVGKERAIKYFRPPYGQRNDKIVDFLSTHKGKVMLWNIDSQDWNAKITSQEVADRVMTLMLLWRRGIILFHDIHSKASTALPIIFDSTKNTNVEWMDAKTLH
jgi:peptidoglycan/xylan/chitin deacetylase (PgdA/CDA1 family)